MCFHSYLGKTAAVGLVLWPMGLKFPVWVHFLEPAYQHFFTPIEKDLWTKEVEPLFDPIGLCQQRAYPTFRDSKKYHRTTQV